MSVNPKEKKMLQEMWTGAESAAGTDIPDGTYQFEIVSARFHMTDKNKPTFKTKVKVTGGDEEYIGQSFETNDNLETKENMGWFKRKLRKLNITITDDFDDIIDGAVAEEMEGLVFEGQVKTKNDFMNLYVNRLIGEAGKVSDDDDGEEEKPKAKKAAKEEEEEETEEAESSELTEGDQVTWGDGKEGEIVEILEDDGKARVKLEDDSIVRVKLDLLSKAEKSEKGDKEEETKDDEESIELPDAEDVEDMKAPDVRKVLKSLGFDPGDIKDPRGVLHSFCALAGDEKAKLDLSEIKPLADALEVELKKNAPMKDQLKALAKAVEAKLN